MKYTYVALTAAILASTPAIAADFSSFEAETEAVSNTIKCPLPKVTKISGMPDLWGCILPGAEVVKVFVNAADGGRVENVKIMWNDWTRDTGYGLHTDKAMAEAWVTALATRYVSTQVQEVLTAFRGTSTVTIKGEGVSLKYTYFKGPAIDERLITVTAP
ncbi:hypothetical protein [Rhizobium rhizophilum]|uniref:Uncharacterized protein n=1 Tax=Rhizobium rhizophilum TaxID=1850373 RepID=A0ABY2QRY1_9HYPH|nr:hypothetical protein [Rhizobium rhizophilum]THV12369.1 hypothetical protein E9677_16420 [Rhizobium rhizophilum]